MQDAFGHRVVVRVSAPFAQYFELIDDTKKGAVIFYSGP
jgi:hypothetical protein